MESMTIACTRCGATCEGDLILPPVAFTFKHNEGCGHGVGPLAVLPGSKKKPEKSTAEKHADKFNEEVVKEIKVEESKPKKEKSKIFGKLREKKDA